MVVPITHACIAAAAVAFGFSGEMNANPLYPILAVEGGRIGQCVQNTNGTEDCGPFQINTVWHEHFRQKWGLASLQEARMRLRDDGCAGAYAAAEILRDRFDDTGGDLRLAIGQYHSRSPALRDAYIGRVRKAHAAQFPQLYKPGEQ